MHVYERQGFMTNDNNGPGTLNRVRRRLLQGVVASAPLAALSFRARGESVSGSASSSTPPAGTALWSRSSVSAAGVARYLCAGTIDYFRCPASLWRDRILKAKRAGLNTIATCVAWNQHERTEGQFDFSGRSDLRQFLQTCADLKMMAFVRLGPFICDEFEAGGYPAWLIGKAGSDFRVRSAITEPYLERWFAQLCAQVAPMQATRGGPVVLVEAENEYFFSGRPGGLGYLDYLVTVVRSNGIDVPVVGVESGRATVLAKDTLPTLHGYDVSAQVRFRENHPQLPLLIAEMYTDWMDCWGWDATEYPAPAMLEQQAFNLLSRQCMSAYFCFHGGTSFGFMGSSTWKSEHSWVTNRYYPDGPVAEGGALNETYFAVKSAGLVAANFEEFFATAVPVANPIVIRGPVLGRTLASPRGLFICVLPQQPIVQAFKDEVRDGRVTNSVVDSRPTVNVAEQPGDIVLGNGRAITLAAGSARPLVIPFHFRVDERCVIDYCNATLLGIGGTPARRTLVLWGESGRRCVISINGIERQFIISRDRVTTLNVAGATILCVCETLMRLTWFADGWVIVGADYAGEATAAGIECWLSAASGVLVAVAPDGNIHRQSAATADAPTTALQSLTWQRFTPAEPDSKTGWIGLPGPRSAEQIEQPYGYIWYRAKAQRSTIAGSGLLFSAASDRVHVWADGRYQGLWGRGSGASRDLLDLGATTESTIFTFLCDNMGRSSEGSAHQSKGISGPAYLGARRVSLQDALVNRSKSQPQESWQFTLFQAIGLAKGNFYDARWSVARGRNEGLVLALRDLPKYAWLYVDGQLVAEHRGESSLLDGFSSTDHVLEPLATGTYVDVRVVVYSDAAVDLNQYFRASAFPGDGALQDWSYRPWRALDPNAPAAQGDSPAGPCLWRARTARPALADPIFFATQGLGKGQLYLNGEPMGRYWDTLGPHHSVYLPEFKAENEILLFDEDGRAPDQTYLFRDTRVPSRKLLA